MVLAFLEWWQFNGMVYFFRRDDGGVLVVKVMDSGIVVGEFELQS